MGTTVLLGLKVACFDSEEKSGDFARSAYPVASSVMPPPAIAEEFYSPAEFTIRNNHDIFKANAGGMIHE
jgi:hypothetical protein